MNTWTAPLQALRREQLRGRLDPWLLPAAVALAAFGVVMVASSSIAVAEGEGLGPHYFLFRHLIFLALGCGLAAAATLVPMAFWNRHSRVLLLFGFLLLLLVFLPMLGVRINGARRWLDLGLANFQVVEAVKLLLILYLASYLVRFQGEVQHRLGAIVKPLLVTALMVLCLLAQPDFGSSALLIAIALGMIWLAGARLRDLVVLVVAATPMMAWAALSESYRLKRLTSFLDPWQDPYNSGFQLVQALIAVGRGEWFGVGLGASVQKLFYLPEAHNDFIFAVIAEEFGLLGVILVVAAFAFLCGRLFLLGNRAIMQGLQFSGFVCHGVGLWIAAQALVSIGVNLGVLPTKGLTLPLISSGGSSLLMTCAAIGVCLRVGLESTRSEAIAAISPTVASTPPQADGVDHAR
ncbi:MAG: putative lipid II flippase FtsW [Lysobacterales bacterium]